MGTTSCFVQSLETYSSVQMVAKMEDSQRTEASPPSLSTSLKIPSRPGAFPFFIWEIAVLISSSVMGLHSSSSSSGLLFCEGAWTDGGASKTTSLTWELHCMTEAKCSAQRRSLFLSLVSIRCHPLLEGLRKKPMLHPCREV